MDGAYCSGARMAGTHGNMIRIPSPAPDRAVSYLPRFILCLLLVSGTRPILAQDVPGLIRQYADAIHAGVDGRRVAAAELVRTFYAGREFAPLWTDPARYDAVLDVVRGAALHGLDPADYHADGLAELAAAHTPPRIAARDILATDALIRLGYHLHFGKVDPVQLDPAWNLPNRLHDTASVELLGRVLAAPDLVGFVNHELAPNGPLYAGLLGALARYREIARAGGWPAVPAGPTLKPDMHGPRVTALRARLAVTDAPAPTGVPDPALYDAALVAAVKRFQERHGLDADGLVGERTLAALNVPVAARIDQLRVNLERARWVFRMREPRYLLVNIAGFRAYLLEDGKVVWRARVMVGTPYRKTPVFKARMTYLVLNPDWTVPPTILKNDIIPRLVWDPDYLVEHDMDLRDRAGQRVAFDAAVLAHIDAGRFPYTVRQAPGRNNPLGRIKFMLPNEHAVYLHDTPNRSLFARADRGFSSGCIRVEHPLALAAHLLADIPGWNRVQLDERIATGVTETVTLKTPISVYIMYWTAQPDADGQVVFFNDLYARDAAVLAALKAP